MQLAWGGVRALEQVQQLSRRYPNPNESWSTPSGNSKKVNAYQTVLAYVTGNGS